MWRKNTMIMITTITTSMSVMTHTAIATSTIMMNTSAMTHIVVAITIIIVMAMSMVSRPSCIIVANQ